MINKTELIKKSIEVIKKNKVITIEDLVSYLPCSKKCFYNKKLHELPEIKELVEENKVMIKSGLRKKWYEGDNATAQIALYKLCATKDERRILGLKEYTEEDNERDQNQFSIVWTGEVQPVKWEPKSTDSEEMQ